MRHHTAVTHTKEPTTPTTHQTPHTQHVQSIQRSASGANPQDPTTCHQRHTSPVPSARSTHPHPPHTPIRSVSSCACRTGATRKQPVNATNYRCSTHEHPPAPHSGTRNGLHMLLRKEVIQPHLPVRLPCYDLVPIASPTFDGSPPQGLGHRLRVLPTFVT